MIENGIVVLVRTYSAGVHFGTLARQEGREVELTNARRIWRWRGANTLNELSQKGLNPASEGYSRVSEPVPFLLLTEAIEVIPCSVHAIDSIVACGWAK